jgi:predicted outer membrane repeat protein
MPQTKILLLPIFAFIFLFSSLSNAATYNIADWSSLSTNYNSATGDTTFNIQDNITFASALTQTPTWSKLTITSADQTIKTFSPSDPNTFPAIILEVNKEIILYNLAFENFYNEFYGGALSAENSARFTFRDFQNFSANSALSGGAISAQNNATLSFIRSTSTFLNNEAVDTGGAIDLYAAIFTSAISSISFVENASQQGGAISLTRSSLDANDTFFNFITNSALTTDQEKGGGAIYADNSKIKAINKTIFDFISNSAQDASGGAIFYTNSQLSFEYSSLTFIQNEAINGGAIFAADELSTFKAIGSAFNFIENQATVGAAIYAKSGASFDFSYSTLSVIDNTGAIFTTDRVKFKFSASLINWISNTQSAAIVAQETSNFDFANSNVNFISNAGAIALNDSQVNFANSKIKFVENETNSNAGAIFAQNNSRLRFTNSNVLFENNSADNYGGAIFAKSNDDDHNAISQFDFISSTINFISNSANDAGAIYLDYSKANFTNSSVTFNTNDASASGGAIYSDDGQINFTNSQVSFDNNSAGGAEDGGAIYATVSLINFSNSKVAFINNKANQGGGIYAADSDIRFTNSSIIFDGNTEGDKGGGIFMDDFADVRFINSVLSFTNNSANEGSAIYTVSNTAELVFQNTKIIFSKNTDTILYIATDDDDAVSFNGGTIELSSHTAEFTFTNDWESIVFNPTQLLFIDNHNADDGGIQMTDFQDMFDIGENTNLNIKALGNTSDSDGGAFAFESIGDAETPVLIPSSNFLFQNNSAQNGGALYISNSIIEIQNPNFINNHATAKGGAIYIVGTAEDNSASLTIKNQSQNVLFTNNTDADSRNDIYLDSFSTINFNASQNKSITINSGIKSTQDTLIFKAGLGNLIFDTAAIIDFKGELFLDQGSLILLTKTAQISTLTINSPAKLSLKNNQINRLNIDNGLIQGNIEFDIDFKYSTGDVLFAADTIEIEKNAILTINPQNFIGIKNEVQIISANNLIYTDGNFIGYDLKIYDVYKYNNSIFVRLASIPFPQMSNLDFNQSSVLNILDQTTDDQLKILKNTIASVGQEGNILKLKKILSQLSGSFIIDTIKLSANTANIDRAINFNLPDQNSLSANIIFEGSTLSNDKNNLGDFTQKASGVLLNAGSNKSGEFFAYTKRNINQDSDTATLADIEFGAYRKLDFAGLAFSGAASFAYQLIDIYRNIDVVKLTPHSRFETESLRAGIDATYTIDIYKPFIGARAAIVLSPKIEEYDGGVANLGITQNSYLRVQTLAGVSIDKTKNNIFYYGKFYLALLLAGEQSQYQTYFLEDKASGNINTKSTQENLLSYNFGGGINFKATKNISVFIDADINFAADYFGYKGNIGGRFQF